MVKEPSTCSTGTRTTRACLSKGTLHQTWQRTRHKQDRPLNRIAKTTATHVYQTGAYNFWLALSLPAHMSLHTTHQCHTMLRRLQSYCWMFQKRVLLQNSPHDVYNNWFQRLHGCGCAKRETLLKIAMSSLCPNCWKSQPQMSQMSTHFQHTSHVSLA